ncbi:MAG: peptidase M64 [Bacteroidales bacterium]|nr:peptidase M64 [Bacteroidales bacterium]MBN2756576.1 peptidase M64 [Bacteroidales bacterium]
MKKYLLFIILISNTVFAQINFDDYFLNKTLRFDYTRAGNSDTSYVFFEQLKEEPFWGGSKINLIDKFNFGDYMLIVYDSTGQNLLYSRGYSSLFKEWIDTEEATETSRSYYESVVMPFPKEKIIVKIQNRDRKNIFHTVFEYKIDPKSYFIVKETYDKYSTEKIYYSGNYNKKLDIAILPDGYTKEEIGKLKTDANRFIKAFFEVSPFKENKDKVNFWLVNAESEESGTDIPGTGVWKKTILNTHFYTFNSERYLTTRDVKKIRDLASYVPYDQIYILVNTKKYGGGGIYNYYNLCSSDNELSTKVFTHEFGHAFAALADEYTYGFDNAEELYDLSVEPWQANISTLVDFESKWKNMVDKKTPIPTPDTEEFKDKVGAFEGAGYVTKKVFRPTHDCKMKSNNTNEFCPVCYKTVLEMLNFYSE